jgi:hypothetical protein
MRIFSHSALRKSFVEVKIICCEFRLEGKVSSRNKTAFIFGNNDFIGAGVAHGLSVPLLACTRDDNQFGIKRLSGNGYVEVVSIVVNGDANAASAFDPGGLEDGMAFSISTYHKNTFFQELRIKPSLVSMRTKGIWRRASCSITVRPTCP